MQISQSHIDIYKSLFRGREDVYAVRYFLSIPKKQIGQIGNQKDKIGKEITIAMIQSLTRT